jgi:hypothetical protein
MRGLSQPISGVATKLSTHPARHAPHRSGVRKSKQARLFLKKTSKTLLIPCGFGLAARLDLNFSESPPANNGGAGHRRPQNLMFRWPGSGLLTGLNACTSRWSNA